MLKSFQPSNNIFRFLLLFPLFVGHLAAAGNGLTGSKIILARKQKGVFTDLEYLKQKFKNDRGKVINLTASYKGSLSLLRKRLKRFQTGSAAVRSGLLELSVPVNMVSDLADIDGIVSVRQSYTAFPMSVSGEEITLTGADELIAASYRAFGVKVAVIDSGFNGLSSAISGRDLPNTAVLSNFTPDSFESGTDHGTAVAEVIHELASNAQLYLIRISNEVDLALARDYCQAEGVQVICHAMGWFGTGSGNGDGIICDIVNEAYSNGILWVNAAGNQASRHWQGTATAVSNYQVFGGVTNVNSLGILSAGEKVALYLTWDEAWGASASDYDLYLMRAVPGGWEVVSNGGTPVISEVSQNGNDDPVEAIIFTLTTGGTYGVRIINRSLSLLDLRLFSVNHDLQYALSTGSIVSPADAMGAWAVGAIPAADWAAGTIGADSSLGPLPGGGIKPDICGTEDISGFTRGTFSGTSAASATAAGIAALTWGIMSASNNSDIISFLEANAYDLGAPGKDNTFGAGKLDISLAMFNIYPAPVVTVPGGFTTNQTFTLNISVDKDFGYWSTNGGSSFSLLPVAGTNLLISATTTVDYYGRDPWGNNSPTNSQTYVVAPPGVPLVSVTPTGNILTNEPFTVSLSVNSNHGYWSTNGISGPYSEFGAGVGVLLDISNSTVLYIYGSNVSGMSPVVSYIYIVNTGAPPALPSGFSAQNVSTDSFDLVWTDQSFDETAFLIYYGTNGLLQDADLVTVPAGTENWSLSGLSPGSTYYVWLAASNASGIAFTPLILTVELESVGESTELMLIPSLVQAETIEVFLEGVPEDYKNLQVHNLNGDLLSDGGDLDSQEYTADNQTYLRFSLAPLGVQTWVNGIYIVKVDKIILYFSVSK